MSGTKAGAKRATETIYAKYGKDYFSKVGAKGGSSPKTRPAGFAAKIPCSCGSFPTEHFKVQCAGRKGGKISRRS